MLLEMSCFIWVALLVTVSGGVDLDTSKYVADANALCLWGAANMMITVYLKTGFHVRTALADGQFDCIHNHLQGTYLNATAAVGACPRNRTLNQSHSGMSPTPSSVCQDAL